MSIGATVVFLATVVYALMERRGPAKTPGIVDIPRDIRFWICRRPAAPHRMIRLVRAGSATLEVVIAAAVAINPGGFQFGIG